jgi:hypothetical protein
MYKLSCAEVEFVFGSGHCVCPAYVFQKSTTNRMLDKSMPEKSYEFPTLEMCVQRCCHGNGFDLTYIWDGHKYDC